MVAPTGRLPGLAIVVLTSANRTVTDAVPVLLFGLGSVTPAGGVTAAVLVIGPLTEPSAVAVKVKVTRPPDGKVATLPLTLLPATVAVAPWPLTKTGLTKPAGRLSVKVAPLAALGPALVMTTVKVTWPPAATAAGVALLVRARSATGLTVMAAVPVLLFGLGSVTPTGGVTAAVLVIGPLTEPSAVAVKVKVTRPPDGKVATLPLTLLPATVAVAPWPLTKTGLTKPAGRLSVKVAPLAALGPALVMTTVKVTWPPAATAAGVALLVRARSATGLTVNVAVTGAEFEPTDVVSEPAGIVLTLVASPVTTTETEQEAPGAITVPAATMT